MCDRLHLNSMKQTETPLNKVFFSDFNIQIVQKSIRQAFKNKTGVSIDYQNAGDLYAIMRVVFINNAGNHYANVVIKTTLPQIQSGVAQYMGYIRDIDTLVVPPTPPANTSTYGMKLEPNDKIGV